MYTFVFEGMFPIQSDPLHSRLSYKMMWRKFLCLRHASNARRARWDEPIQYRFLSNPRKGGSNGWVCMEHPMVFMENPMNMV